MRGAAQYALPIHRVTLDQSLINLSEVNESIRNITTYKCIKTIMYNTILYIYIYIYIYNRDKILLLP